MYNRGSFTLAVAFQFGNDSDCDIVYPGVRDRSTMEKVSGAREGSTMEIILTAKLRGNKLPRFTHFGPNLGLTAELEENNYWLQVILAVIAWVHQCV